MGTFLSWDLGSFQLHLNSYQHAYMQRTFWGKTTSSSSTYTRPRVSWGSGYWWLAKSCDKRHVRTASFVDDLRLIDDLGS